MKTGFLTLALLACATFSAVASHKSVTNTAAGSLAKLIGTEARNVDSLTVAGPMNLADLRVAWDGAANGELKYLNISKAKLPGNKLPDYAFYVAEEQKGEKSALDIDEIVLPDSLVEIGAYAFRYCLVTKMKLPETLTKLGEGAFYSCNLTNEWRGDDFRLPEGVEEIPDYCFFRTVQSHEFHFPSTIRRIGEYAFFETLIHRIVLPESLEEIGYRAFYRCAVKEVEFTGGCRTLGEEIFVDCPILESIVMPNDPEVIPPHFVGAAAVTELFVPECVRRIESHAFSALHDLQTVVLPSNLAELGDQPITQCGLKTIDIYCHATVPPVCEGYVLRGGTSFNLYVLPGTKELYAAAPGWNEAKSVTEMSADDFPVAGIGNPAVGDAHSLLITAGHGSITVTSTSGQAVSVTIYNLDGKLFFAGEANPTITVDLPAGAYIVTAPPTSAKVIL